MNESKVTYEENGRIRAIRGQVDESDPFFVIIERRDGTFKVNKKMVLTIERWNGERNEPIRQNY